MRLHRVCCCAGKVYRLNPKVATLLIRPRGWHLEEVGGLDCRVDGAVAWRTCISKY